MKFAFSRARRDAQTENIIIAFFFNARGDTLEKSTAGLYRSLLFQLLDEFPDLQAVLDDTTLIPRRQKSCPSVDVLQELLRNVISGLGQRCLTCFIDALDECDEEQVRQMVVFFEDLSEEAIGSNVHLSICFSSRHYPHIDVRNGLKLVLEDQPGHQEDMEKYVKSYLRAGNGPYVDRVRAQILERAGGVFIWVVLVVELLNKEFTRGRMFAVEKRLQEIPSKLSELFKDILSRDDDDMGDFLLCIQWILYAERPLKRKEFYFAIRSGLTDVSDDMWTYDPEQDTDEAMDLLIVSASRGLAEITKSSIGVVQFIHESVIDFLVKEKGLQLLWPELWPDFSSISHERLKQCCLSHITPYIFRKTLNGSATLPPAYSWKGKMIREGALEKFPFLEYAARQVLHHFEAASAGVPQDSFLENFPLKDWIHLTNVPQVQEIRRYPPNTTMAYILAENNMVALLGCHVRHHPNVHVHIPGTRFGLPLFAALVDRHLFAAKALFGPAALPFSADELFCSYLKHEKKQPPLHWAIQAHNVTLAKLMISSGYFNCEAIDEKGQSAVHVIALAGDDAAILIQPLIKRPFVSGEDMDSTTTPVTPHSPKDGPTGGLGDSLRSLEYEMAKPWVDSRNLNGRSPLSLAAGEGHEAVVQTLLRFNVDLESTDNEHRRTPLCFAAEAGHISIIRLLLDRESAIDSTDRYGNTPLSSAIANGHEAAAVLLIERGANPNGQSANGPAPLYTAAEKRLQKTVQLLLESGASATNNNSTTCVPLLVAAAAGDNSIVSLLLQHGASVDGPLSGTSNDTPLYKAASEGHEATAKLLLSHGASLEALYTDYRLALFTAAFIGNESVVEWLLEKGVSADSIDKKGYTALHVAAYLGFASILQLLLQHGASVDRADDNGETPLYKAARCGKRAAVQVLLENLANVNTKPKSGGTALEIAVEKGHKAVVKDLIAHGALSGSIRSQRTRFKRIREAVNSLLGDHESEDETRHGFEGLSKVLAASSPKTLEEALEESMKSYSSDDLEFV